MQLNQTAYRVFSLLGITGILCVIYFLVLVPQFETPVSPKPSKLKSEKSQIKVDSSYLPYFQEGAWECSPNDRHLINSQNFVMFFHNVTNEGFNIKSDECTILIAPGKKTFPVTPKRGQMFHPIKVNMYDGVEILFDSKDGQILPTPLKGRLLGRVQISYKVPINGFWVDCLVRTSDLTCNMKSLQTSRSVEFFLGQFTAKGSNLNILFQNSSNKKELFSGITSVELGHLEYITLKLTPLILQQMNFKMTPDVEKRIQTMFGNRMEIPVTLHCDGSMIYNVKEGIIKFSKNVNLVCNYPNSPKDSLHCEELELHLVPDLEKRLLHANQAVDETSKNISENQPLENSADKNQISENQISEKQAPETIQESITTKPQTPPENDSRTGDLPLNSIQAKQDVVLELPTFNASAKSENLVFFTENQMLQLSGSEQATINFDQYEFHAFDLSYTFPPQNMQGLGRIQCDQRGGWFKVAYSSQSGTSSPNSFQSANSPEEVSNVIVSWKESLRGIPQENGYYDIYVTGGVDVQSPEFGSLNADSISARLRARTPEDEKKDMNLALELGIPVPQMNTAGNMNPAAQTGKKPTLIPEYVTANGNVRLKVDQKTASLDARLAKIQFTFQKPPHIPDVMLQVQKTKVQEKSTGQNHFQSHTTQNSESPKRNFIMTAGELQGLVHLLPGDESFFIPQLSITGPANQDLILREEAPLQTSEQLISLHARKVLLHDLLPETLQCEIVGSNAVLGGLGVSLECPKMAVNCASNRIDVNCAGKMRVFTRQKAGSNLNYSTLMETVITWQKALGFNGLELVAQENVTVKTPATSLRMDSVQALLTERIQLNKPPQNFGGDEIKMMDAFQTIAAKHNVKLVHQNFDQNNQLTNVCTLKTNFLNYFPGNKIISMNGEGTLSVSCLEEEKTTNLSPYENQEEETPPPQILPKEKKWNQVRMDYNTGITGNLQEGEFIIKGKISALMQPVPQPDFMIPQTHIDPRMLPEGGYQFTCEQVTIDKIPTLAEVLASHQIPKLEDLKLEVKAEGNVKFETSTISADGVTMKYSQEKNMCQILGDERTRVYIIQQEFVGGRRNEMTTDAVEINLKDMHFTLKDMTVQGAY